MDEYTNELQPPFAAVRDDTPLHYYDSSECLVATGGEPGAIVAGRCTTTTTTTTGACIHME